MAGLLVAVASLSGFFYIQPAMEKMFIKSDRTLSVLESRRLACVFSGCWDRAPLISGLTVSLLPAARRLNISERKLVPFFC